MKKIISFLIVIASIFSLSSCNKNKKLEIERDINITEAIDLYATDQSKPNIKNLVDNKKSFLLFVYLPTCLDCKLFSEIYDEYINENKVVLYKTTPSDLLIIEEKAPRRAPYLTIFNEGKMGEVFSFDDHHDLFTKKEEFEKFMDEHCVINEMPIVPTISRETLDSFIKENKEFVVYFGWNQCSDCSYMNENYLADFLKENKKTFYYIETDLYHPTREDDIEGNKKWQDFKNQYGFGSYNDGRIPSICYFKDGECKDFAVYLNDILTFDDENNTVKIENSYYEDNPYIGQEFSGSSLLDAYAKYKDTTKSFYNQKMDEFFEKYLK